MRHAEVGDESNVNDDNDDDGEDDGACNDDDHVCGDGHLQKPLKVDLS